MTNENTIEKMHAILTEMLKAQYNPPSVAGANADDIITRFGVEGLLGNETSIPKGSTYYEIDGNKAVDFSNGTILYAWDGKMYTAHNGMWTEVT